MKKRVLFVCLILACMCCSSCTTQKKPSSSAETSSVVISSSSNVNSSDTVASASSQKISAPRSEVSTNTTSSTASKTLPVYAPGSIKLVGTGDDLAADYDLPFPVTHRFCYYNIDGVFLALIPDDQLESYSNDVITSTSTSTEPTEMALKGFVQKFHITRDQFDAAIEKLKKFDMETDTDMTQEENEIPNADIIYTFDDKIISEYYRRA